MANVTVTDVRKTLATSGPRIGQVETLVTYRAEDGQLFLTVIPKDAPTAQDIQAAIREDMKMRSEHLGKTFSV